MEKSDEDLSNWAFSTLQDVSRTFALSIEYHPKPIKEYVCTAYLLCRIPDTIEDSPELNPEQKVTLLSYFKETVSGEKEPYEFINAVERFVPKDTLKGNPDWGLVKETGKVITLFQRFPDGVQDAIQPWVMEMTYGMQEFVFRYNDGEGIRLQTIEELESYCYYVAGTVGHLLTDIVIEVYDETASGIHKDAEQFGLLLQFVNIAKDVHNDYEDEGNVYLPNSVLSKYDVSQNSVTDKKNIEGVAKSVRDVISHAIDFTGGARSFLSWADDIDKENYTAFASPYALAMATIHELQVDAGLAATPTEVKISREDVFSIVQMLESRDYPSVEEFEKKLLSGELPAN